MMSRSLKYIILGITCIVLILASVGVFILYQHQKKSELVTIRGEFTPTKYGMGVVNKTLIPYFLNKPTEAEQYLGRIVEVTGYLYKSEYPPDYVGQEWLGNELDMVSIRIIEN
jgi:hypothetical protein